jgi:uncharacterized protein (DUF1330 family)
VNRSLLSFLVFLALLVAGFAITAWWVGPTMVSLALDDERRNQPYYLIHLISTPDLSGYFRSFGTLLKEEEAQLLWRGSLKTLHAGRSRDELDDVAIVEFAEGGGVVQMMTSTAYRELTDGRDPVLLGAEMAPGPIASDEVLLLWLFELDEDAERAALDPLLTAASGHGGALVWSTAVDVLGGGRQWNHALMLAFPDTDSVQSWLADPETATIRSLVRRNHQGEALLELAAG